MIQTTDRFLIIINIISINIYMFVFIIIIVIIRQLDWGVIDKVQSCL